jgi:hypothetical protein
MMSYVLQYLLGFHRLGHDVWFVERARYADECFDPARGAMSDDPSYGTEAVDRLLRRFGLGERWCFTDVSGRYHGRSRTEIEDAFRTADLFIDMGTHGAWSDEARGAGLTVLLDGEPGYNQMRMERGGAAGELRGAYDRYYTAGLNVGSEVSSAPTAGLTWGHLLHPVVPELFESGDPGPGAPMTTVMNWASHAPVEHEGVTYGQKDVEFAKFAALPTEVRAPMELAVAGPDVPRQKLEALGWTVRDAHSVTASFDSFREYVAGSLGEFSVCKNVFVETRSGWFSDRSAAYLAAGRPVVLQETGFSDHLPVGRGLFAVETREEAVEAVERISCEWRVHSDAAADIAREHLDARVVLGRFLTDLGVE